MFYGDEMFYCNNDFKNYLNLLTLFNFTLLGTLRYNLKTKK